MADFRKGILSYKKEITEDGKVKSWWLIIKTIEGDIRGRAYISTNPWLKSCGKGRRVEFQTKLYEKDGKSYTTFENVTPTRKPRIRRTPQEEQEKDLQNAISREQLARAGATYIAGKIAEGRMSYKLPTSLITLSRISDLWADYILTGQIDPQEDEFDRADLLDKTLVCAKPAWETQKQGNVIP